jgi:rfaE bifunctional protein kinase chain/domain
MNISSGISRFSEKRVLVIGDVMMDAYCWGKVERISPEAPVPVVNVHQWDRRLGGAANVALNAVALGAAVSVCSILGDDSQGKQMLDLLTKENIATRSIVLSKDRPTTVKTRVIAGGHHIVRIDEEVTFPLHQQEESQMLDALRIEMEQHRPDVIILEDYNKGVLTSGIIRWVLQMAKQLGIPTTVDPKKDHFFEYTGCTLFKPNLKEMKEGLKMEIDPKSENALKNINIPPILVVSADSKGSKLGDLKKVSEVYYINQINKQVIKNKNQDYVSTAQLDIMDKFPGLRVV